MRLRRVVRALAVLAAVAVLALLSGCGFDGDREAPPNPQLKYLRVALFPAGNTLPVHVAAIRGIFERNRLHVDLTEGQDLPLFMAAQSKGQYDIAMTTPTLVLLGAQKGLDLQIVSSTAQQSRERPNAVWITKDESIRSLTELNGKTIAVPSLTGIIIDSVVYLLQRDGVDRRDVRFVQTPFPAMGDQLQAGHVDAAIATLPYSTAIAARGFRVHNDVTVEAVHDASDGTVDDAITTVWSAPRRFAADHPEAIAAWRTSLREAIEFLDHNPGEARALMAGWLKIPTDVLERAPLPDWTVDITPQQLVPYVGIARAVGSIDSDPDVNSLVWQGP
jgi:NitT/TauT family transport system substrate-binding protein